MFQTLLLLEFVVYILSLLLGFKIAKKNKDKHNKRYKHFKKPLYVIITAIFLLSLLIIQYAASIVSWLKYVFIAEMLFILYFFVFTFKETRCWKQHRMILFNFLLIPAIYFSSLVLQKMYLNYFVILICVYNILEFQFAKFDIKKPWVWD